MPVILGWGVYTLYGHRLVTDIYEGRSVSFLNALIKWQSVQPLEYYLELADKSFFSLLLTYPFILVILYLILRPKFIIIGLSKSKWLSRHTDFVDAIPDSHIGLWIALAAGLSLYSELMIIRLHSSYFQLFAYFKNVSLLSCFLGLGIGYARGSKRPLTTPLVLPFFALQIIFMYILRYNPIVKLLQNPISEQLSFGLDQAKDVIHMLISCGFLILIFSLNALCFVPLGQLASRLMARRQNLVAYGWNLIGSLSGILLFSIVSFMWAPPSVWIALFVLALVPFLYKDMVSLWASFFAAALVLIVLALPFRLNEFDVYSPYQVLTLIPSKDGAIKLNVNNSSYHAMHDFREENMRNNERLKQVYARYAAPYFFKPKPEHVLIVGSGTGNDVVAAIHNGAGRIDAVDIDPAVIEFGRQLHPNSPYQAGNVNVIVNDARAFIRHTDQQYDLIVYGLLDSNILLSGRSGGIRLDSYVYTVEGFREAKKKLKDDGIISLSFSVISPELGRKLFLMLKEAFNGQSPIVYEKAIFLIGDGLKKHLLPQYFFLRETTAMYSDNQIQVDKSTDDWPFFYMPTKKYPVSYLSILLILLLISITYIRQIISDKDSSFSAPCFFLGAGFMLIETKGITELALVYGSTWVVISVVVMTILIMSFLANLLVINLRKSPSRSITYGLLLISLLAGFALTFADMTGMALQLRRIIMTTLLMLPLFFSGFAFSSELKKSSSVASALSSNLLGAMLGGFLEYNSMYFGFRSLYILAILVYVIAFWGSKRPNNN